MQEVEQHLDDRREGAHRERNVQASSKGEHEQRRDERRENAPRDGFDDRSGLGFFEHLLVPLGLFPLALLARDLAPSRGDNKKGPGA